MNWPVLLWSDRFEEFRIDYFWDFIRRLYWVRVSARQYREAGYPMYRSIDFPSLRRAMRQSVEIKFGIQKFQDELTSLKRSR